MTALLLWRTGIAPGSSGWSFAFPSWQLGSGRRTRIDAAAGFARHGPALFEFQSSRAGAASWVTDRHVYTDIYYGCIRGRQWQLLELGAVAWSVRVRIVDLLAIL